ncbi:ead/Ea22-like family protein [Klebsiella michiganensis]|uniref:ead/Ea22-like family protein n=1 Tax=Klebsiella michiganensis TaxID=1134687 RepID=UPI001D0E3705|nr:ead/Ea22-like family protein [Klebsiella michiganensis]
MTTDITELAQSLKAAAENATPGEWCSDDQYGVVADAGLNGNYYIASCSGPEHRSNKRFIALANPANILALVGALEKAQQHIARQEQIILNQNESLSIRRGELEAAQQEWDNWRTSFDNERFRADKLKAHIDDMETIRAAAEKRIAGLEIESAVKDASNLELKQQYQRLLESRTVTIEPFRSFVTDADLAALHRFAECCDDPESGGHDLEKEQVRRLEAIGALQRSGLISYITGFGDVLISITAGTKVEAE